MNGGSQELEKQLLKESFDNFYGCRICGQVYVFQEDMQNHTMITGHHKYNKMNLRWDDSAYSIKEITSVSV